VHQIPEKSAILSSHREVAELSFGLHPKGFRLVIDLPARLMANPDADFTRQSRSEPDLGAGGRRLRRARLNSRFKAADEDTENAAKWTRPQRR